jgi:hypothetical protein
LSFDPDAANCQATPPPIPDPQYAGYTFSSLCAVGITRLLLTGIFLDIMRQVFASSDYIEDGLLRPDLVWNPGDTTGILIESVTAWKPRLTEKRPAIIVKPNSWTNMRRGIGDLRQGPPADHQGNQHFITHWVGSHTLFCIGNSGAQAEILAAETQHHITQSALVIAKSVGLQRLQVLEIGPVSELEEATETFSVPVTAGYGVEQKWILRQQAPRINRLSLKLLLAC